MGLHHRLAGGTTFILKTMLIGSVLCTFWLRADVPASRATAQSTSATRKPTISPADEGMGDSVGYDTRDEPPDRPTNAEIADLLHPVVGMRDFSVAHPLNNPRFTVLLRDLAYWRLFPSHYLQNAHTPPKSYDGYILKPMVSLFVHDRLHQNLSAWAVAPGLHSVAIQGNKLLWKVNTSNSMFEPPYVIVRRSHWNGRDTVIANLAIIHHIGNMSQLPPATNVGSAVVTLKYLDGNWAIVSWHVQRTRNWSFLGEK